MDRRQVPLDRRPPICRARPLGQTVIEPPKPEFRTAEPEPPALKPKATPKTPAPKETTKQGKPTEQQEEPATPETIQVLT